MGLFSKIKKAVKSVVKGVKKVFGKVLKPFAPILNSKIFKAVMMVSAVFTMGATLMGTAGSFLGESALGKFAADAASFLSKYNPTTMISKAVKTGLSKVGAFASGTNAAAPVAEGVASVGQTAGESAITETAGGVSSDAMASTAIDSLNPPGATDLFANGTGQGGNIMPTSSEGLINTAGRATDQTAMDYMKGAVSGGSGGSPAPGLIERFTNAPGKTLWEGGKATAGFFNDNPVAGQMLMGAVEGATKEEDWRREYYERQMDHYDAREQHAATYRPRIAYGS